MIVLEESQAGPNFTLLGTASLVPVNINAILCQNERTLEQLHRVTGNHVTVT